MHRAKVTCTHGHPWYRLDCTQCGFDEFHDLLRLSLAVTMTRREPPPDPTRYVFRFEFDYRLIASQVAKMTTPRQIPTAITR